MSQLFNTTKYVFDSGPFIDLNNYPPDIFLTFWDKLNEMLKEAEIISSIEVYRELEDYNDEFVAEWTKKNKKYFLKPSLEEQQLAKEILAKFPNLIKEDTILAGKPLADPFVIAQAKLNNCILVHQEKFKPNAHKIPNVCEHFNVNEISLFEFFRKEKWKF